MAVGSRRRATWKGVLLAAAVFTVYALLFIALHPRFGSALTSLSILPVVTAAWTLGLPAGVLTAFYMVPLNALLLSLSGEPGLEIVLIRGWSGHLVLLIVGGVVGWSSQLVRRVRQQSQLLMVEREALRKQVHERGLVESRLTQAKAEAEAASEAKTEFVSVVSHELQTPLTYIRGYTDLLLEGSAGQVNETQARFLRVVKDNVGRMTQLITDLAEVSRIEERRVRLELADLELAEVVRDVILASQSQFEEKELELLVNVSVNLPSVRADRGRLIQVLSNLIGNALKYTPRGGRIEIHAQPEGPAEASSFVEISVSDNGLGIKKDEQDRVFQKFFRSKEPNVRQVAGTGLGLSIAKTLVELQGGRIWFESTQGRGTTMFFTVPVARSAAERAKVQGNGPS